MKKLLLILKVTVCLNSYGQNVTIPDANFKSLLVNNASINTDQNTEISTDEAAAFTGTIFASNKDITDLTGIEAFTALTKLECAHNQLNTLNLSSNAELVSLISNHNELSSIDVSSNLLLTQLILNNNQLTTLDITNNTALETLNCSINQITSLNVSNNTALTTFDCGQNQIMNLDVTTNALLTDLRCDNNELANLNISQNKDLEVVWVFHNELSTIDVISNSKLSVLELNGNKLSSIDVSENTSLHTLSLAENSISSIDISSNPELSRLYVGNNQLSTIDVSNNPLLKTLAFTYNNITTLDVSGNTILSELHIGGNQLTELNVTNNEVLQKLTCFENQLTSLDLSQNPLLTQLECQDNQLQTVNLRNGGNSGKGLFEDFNMVNNRDLSCILVDDLSGFEDRWWDTAVDYPAYTTGECIQATSVTITTEEESTSIEIIGNTLQMTANVEPDNATSSSVIWSVSDPNIAVINEDGLLTAITNGEVLVSAEAAHQSEISDEIVITIGVVSGIDENQITQLIYPNPVDHNINIAFKERTNAEISLLTINGHVLKKITNQHRLTSSLNVSGIKSGLYLLQIETKKQKFIKKIQIN